MSTYQSKGRKAPHATNSFWANSDNWFWLTNGLSYTETSKKRFQEIVNEAIENELRWHKPDSKNLWKR